MFEEALDKFSRKTAAFAIHMMRKTQQSYEKSYAKACEKYEKWFDALSLNVKRAVVVSRITGYEFRFVIIEEDGIEKYYAQFIKRRKKMGIFPDVVGSISSETKDDAARKLIESVTPSFNKSLNQLLLIEAVKRG